MFHDTNLVAYRAGNLPNMTNSQTLQNYPSPDSVKQRYVYVYLVDHGNVLSIDVPFPISTVLDSVNVWTVTVEIVEVYLVIIIFPDITT